jgi:hypothetical protein
MDETDLPIIGNKSRLTRSPIMSVAPFTFLFQTEKWSRMPLHMNFDSGPCPNYETSCWVLTFPRSKSFGKKNMIMPQTFPAFSNPRLPNMKVPGWPTLWRTVHNTCNWACVCLSQIWLTVLREDRSSFWQCRERESL